MMKIGIDLSINSTGICLNEDGQCTYYIIVPKKTRNQASSESPRLRFIEYNKQSTDTENIRMIGSVIESILKGRQIEEVVIEDVAMNARSNSIITLTLLNGYIRCVLDYLKIKFITVPPCKWKKKLLGNGQADKELTIYHWEHLNPEFKELKIKKDDIADAYFLSNYTL